MSSYGLHFSGYEHFLWPEASVFLPYAPSVKFNIIGFQPERLLNHYFQQESFYISNDIADSVQVRKSEYFATRLLAKIMLSDMGVDDYQVGTGLWREPVWPQGFVGSISHAGNSAGCAIVFYQDICSIGIDIEYKRDAASVASIETSVLDRDEYNLLATNSVADSSFLALLVFSAKESIFKAFFPFVKYYFDFSYVKVVDVNTKLNYLHFIVNKDINNSVLSGKNLFVSYSIFKEKVITVSLLRHDFKSEELYEKILVRPF